MQVYKYDGQFMRECLGGQNLQKMSRDFPVLKIATLYRARAGDSIGPDSLGMLAAILKKKPGQFFKLETIDLESRQSFPIDLSAPDID